MSRPSHLRRVTSSPASATHGARRPAPSGGLFTARIDQLLAAGKLLVRDLEQPLHGAPTEVRLALIAGYLPSVGDQLLVSRDGAQPVAIAVLEAARRPALVATDGARAEIVDGSIELCDAGGRLLVRYLDGALEIAPVHGDLRLRAPSGRVEIEAGTDVAISGRSVELRAPSLRAVGGRADLIATEIHTAAHAIVTHARRVETTADRVALLAKEAVTDVAGLLQTRVGRMRSVVRGAFSMRSKTTTMKSDEDTSIDGRRVLLG